MNKRVELSQRRKIATPLNNTHIRKNQRKIEKEKRENKD